MYNHLYTMYEKEYIMYTTTTFQILISCPGDVAERFLPIIKETVISMNTSLKDVEEVLEDRFGTRIDLEIMYWGENGRGEFLIDKTGQDVLNEQLVNNSDGTIGLFYRRLGTKTDRYPSGTVEELEKTLERGKRAAIIFISNRDSERLTFDSDESLKEYGRLQEYLEEVRKTRRGLIINCTPEGLKEQLKRQLQEILRSVSKSMPQGTAKYKSI